MYFSLLDKNNSQVVFFRNLSLTSSRLYRTVSDFSKVSEGFDRLMNWIELDIVDFNRVSLYNAKKHNQFS